MVRSSIAQSTAGKSQSGGGDLITGFGDVTTTTSAVDEFNPRAGETSSTSFGDFAQFPSPTAVAT